MPATVPTKPPPPSVASATSSSLIIFVQEPECDGGIAIDKYAAMFTQLGRDVDERADEDEEEWNDFGTPLEFVKKVDGGIHLRVSKLEPGRRYRFRVRFENMLGHSDWSDKSLVISTKMMNPGRCYSVRARDATHAAVTISWIGPVSDGGSAVTAYEIHAATVGTDVWELVAVRLALHPPHAQQVESSTVVDSLSPGRAYIFAVRALNAFGEGAPSEPSQPVQTKISSPSQPFNPRPAPHGIGATSIALTWDYPRNDGGRQISKYHVQYTHHDPPTHWIDADVGCGCAGAGETDAEGTSMRTIHIGRLSPSTQYYFRIRSFNSEGMSDYALSVPLRTTTAPPQRMPPPEVVSVDCTSLSVAYTKMSSIALTVNASPLQPSPAVHTSSHDSPLAMGSVARSIRRTNPFLPRLPSAQRPPLPVPPRSLSLTLFSSCPNPVRTSSCSRAPLHASSCREVCRATTRFSHRLLKLRIGSVHQRRRSSRPLPMVQSLGE
jgi:hypothetical protein